MKYFRLGPQEDRKINTIESERIDFICDDLAYSMISDDSIRVQFLNATLTILYSYYRRLTSL